MTDLYDVVVIGAGLSGLSFLREWERIGADGSILALEYGDAVGGLLRHALPAEEFEEASQLLADSASGRAEIRCGTTAVGLLPAMNRDDPHVILTRGAGGTTRVSAKRVVLASGGLETPREHDQISGPRPAGVVTPIFVHQALANGLLPGRRAVVYGASKLAVVTALRMATAGIETVLVPPPSSEVSSKDLAPVTVESPSELVAVQGYARLEQVVLRRDGTEHSLPADTLVYAVDLMPNTHWLHASGVATDDRGRVVVDDRYETSLAGVFAIGTVVAPSIDHAHSVAMGAAAAHVLKGDIA